VKIVWPEVLRNYRATFRVLAPKAAEASVLGQWVAPIIFKILCNVDSEHSLYTVRGK
jgi:hypothetical protein